MACQPIASVKIDNRSNAHGGSAGRRNRPIGGGTVMCFEAVWADLKNRLKAGTELRGWSRDKGHTSLRFRIDDVAAGSITVSSPTMAAPRSIGRSDFARVYGAWAKYRAGKFGRAEMT